MAFSELFSFLTILNKSIKLISKNGKLMTFIAIPSTILYSSSFLLFNYALQSLANNMTGTIIQSFMPDSSSLSFPDSSSFNMPDPSSFNWSDPSSIPNPRSFSINMIDPSYNINMSDGSFTMTDPSFNFKMNGPNIGFDPTKLVGLLENLRKDVALLLATQIALSLVSFFIFFLFTGATILISASSYKGKPLCFKDFVITMWKSCKRSLITSIYILCLAIGYIFLIMTLAAPLLIMFPNPMAILVVVLLAIIVCMFYLYLFVSWGLAGVVSVVEHNCYGLEALGRGVVLGKGKRLQGFLMNLSFNILVCMIFQMYKMIVGEIGLVNNPTMFGLFVVNVGSLLNIFMVVAYTVLYFECKKHHGEGIELQGKMQYVKFDHLLGDDGIP